MEMFINDKTPYYITSNKGFYEKIAEEYYSRTAKAKNKEEFDEAVALVCNGYRRDLSNDDVQRFLLASGLMEEEDMERILRFFIEHAGPLQNAFQSANMEVGKKYTLVYLNDTGLPVADKITFYGLSLCTYAQYNDAVKLVFKRCRSRKLTGKFLYNRSVAVYEGWQELKKETTYEKVSETDTFTTWKSKYVCFDARYFTDAVERLGKPLMEYRDFKTRKSDGMVFA